MNCAMKQNMMMGDMLMSKIIVTDFGKGMEHIRSIGNRLLVVFNSRYAYEGEELESVSVNKINQKITKQ